VRAAGDPGGLADPVAYSPAWWALGLGLLATVLVWNLGVAWWGRPRRVRVAAAEPADVAAVRRRHLEQLAEVEAQVGSGVLGAREGVQALSVVARSWVQETTGVPARHLALEDLRSAGPAALAEAVAQMYPSAFGPGAPDELDFRAALRRARAVVGTTWT
jgi:hypothetical protein